MSEEVLLAQFPENPTTIDTSAMMSIATPSRSHVVPLVVGITGHVDLCDEDLATVSEAVDSLLASIESRFPHTPVCLLSPLAEGADRLVARVALQRGAKLVVPLPMAQSEYEKDFASEESLSEFRGMIVEADHCFELPEFNSDDREANSRQRQYAQVGAFIAKHSQLLIALWDGKDAELEGGTSDVVRFALQGVPERFATTTSMLKRGETCPVYHVLVRRSSGDVVSGKVGECRLIMPTGSTSTQHRRSVELRIAANLDRLNREIQSVESQAGAWSASRGQVVEAGDGVQTPTGVDRLADTFSIVDTLATRCQRAWHCAMTGVLMFSCIAAIALQLNTESPGRSPEGLVVYAASLIAACACYFWARWRRFDTRYLDYRAIAEGLRVQIFWMTAGLPMRVADYYLRRQQGVLEWVRNALDAICLRIQTTGDESPTGPESVSWNQIAKLWLTDQQVYFRRTAQKYRSLSTKLSRMAQGLFLLGSIMALSWGYVGGYILSSVLLVVPPVIAAVLLVYANTRALSEHAYQYERMAELFSDATSRFRQLRDSGDNDRIADLFFELGKEALSENADWLILHRDRPLDAPTKAGH